MVRTTDGVRLGVIPDSLGSPAAISDRPVTFLDRLRVLHFV